MSSNNESIGKTLAVVVSLCLVCAVIVSLTSVQLRPLQKANKAKDIQSNILAAAGISKVDNVAETFEAKIETRFIDMQSGDFADPVEDFDFEKTKYDANEGYPLKENGIKDIAGIQRITKRAPVYISKKDDGSTDAIILPIQGYGLWGLMYGLFRLKAMVKQLKTSSFISTTKHLV